MSTSSMGQDTGVGLPGVQGIEMVDRINGYVLCLLKPWTTYQPGDLQTTTVSVHKTYTNAQFDALNTGLSRASTRLMTGHFNSRSGVWSYNSDL